MGFFCGDDGGGDGDGGVELHDKSTDANIWSKFYIYI